MHISYNQLSNIMMMWVIKLVDSSLLLYLEDTSFSSSFFFLLSVALLKSDKTEDGIQFLSYHFKTLC